MFRKRLRDGSCENRNVSKGVPKKDGSGGGRRANRGRGGCIVPTNKDRNVRKDGGGRKNN